MDLFLFAYPYLLCQWEEEVKASTQHHGHRSCFSCRDYLGLSAPSPEALIELELRQAGQWALGHEVPHKPCSGQGSPATPGTRHSLTPAPSSGKYV